MPATEVTAHLPSGLKWKKGNLAREEEKKKYATERRQCKAKGKNVGCYGYTGEEMARKAKKSDKWGNGLNVLGQHRWSWQPGH